MSVKERLAGLLTYTDNLARLNDKAIFSTKNYRTLVYTEHQLQNRVGIHHNVDHPDGIVWLKIDRLQRRDPPIPPATISEWIEVYRDPSKSPKIHDSIMQTMPRDEADQRVLSGVVEEKDVMDSPKGDPESVDVRLQLIKHPEVRKSIDDYVNGPWSDWKAKEIPKLETIAIYEKFFNLCQTMESSGADTPLELVWGLGFALWKTSIRQLEHPLIEAMVELRIDLQSQAILVSTRDRAPQFYMGPFTELGLASARPTQDRMRECYDRLLQVDEQTGTALTDEFSPFDHNSFEPILEVAAGGLTGDGRYWPKVNDDPTDREHPEITDTLTVTDTWAIYARPRSSNFLVDDIGKLRKAIIETDERDIPAVGASLVLDPATKRDSELGGGGSGGGQSGGSTPRNAAFDATEVYFPKPHNDAQLKIIQRLKHEDGVVVQGPPGTGKTHTIANVVCHYLATGRSVLVVSKGEPALAVLRDQIPDGVQNLTISLLTSEREGMNQLEGAVTFMANEVLSKDPEQLIRTSRHDQERIEQLRTELKAIDQRMLALAESQLSKIPENLRIGEQDWPAEVARTVSQDRHLYEWLDDSIGFDERFEPQFSQQDLLVLREARRRIGDDIVYSESVLPNRNDLPTSRVLANAHVNLTQAEALKNGGTNGSLPPIIGRDELSQLSGERLAKDLKLMRQALEHTASAPWLAKQYETWIVDGLSIEDVGSVEAAIVELENLGERRKTFRQRPIALPPQIVSSKALTTALERGGRTGRPFPTISFGPKEIKAFLDEIRIAGQPPEGRDDWKYVEDYFTFRNEIIQFAYRWNAVAEDFGVPEVSLDAKELERWIGDNQKLLSCVLGSALRYRKVSDIDVRTLFPSGVDRKTLPFDMDALAEMSDAIDVFLQRQNLSEARFVVEKVSTQLHDGKGRIFDACQVFLQKEVGSLARDAEWVEKQWAALLAEFDRLSSFQHDFSILKEIAAKVEVSGAPRLAARLRSVPAQAANDSVLPDNVFDAWRFRRLEAFLSSIDARTELMELSSKRIDSHKRLESAMLELVKTQTYIGLHRRMQSGGRLSALRQFLSAIRKIGSGKGVRATRYRGDAQKAMAKCMEAVPCWIMPTWRVSESLPAKLGSFDLVIIDEASQSDIMALPSLLRGKKVLVVGDDRQVSPADVAKEERKLLHLRHNYLRDQIFADLLLPGTSFYELAQSVFPSGSIMLNEHFRCVEPIIRFSLQFYPEKFVPLRIPKPSERLDPPLIDVYIKNATRKDKGKVNEAEVSAIVDEIERLVNDPAYEERSMGVVSLLGNEQSNAIQKRLLERIGEEKFLKHRITCGDPPTFQGKERDIIFLSMVAVPGKATAQTSRQFEQRYNVALSRARDRMYLYRSVTEGDLRNANDLKLRVINHFKTPMPMAVEQMKELIDNCDSEFEKDVFRRLAEMDYRVTPQVAVGDYRIDLVVDGGGDRRLAIELDGDKYHGPDRWFEDYARQKTLERMNWQFWRCWGSSFAMDPDGCMADLIDVLNQKGIEPIGKSGDMQPFTEHRTIDAADKFASPHADDEIADEEFPTVGDALTVIFEDDYKRVFQVILDTAETDLVNGIVSVQTDLGKQLLASQADEEIEVDWGGRKRKCTIQAISKVETLEAVGS